MIRLVIRTDNWSRGITFWHELREEPPADQEASITYVPSSNGGRAPQPRRQGVGFLPSRVKVGDD